jgi:predicted transcriptional regulator
MSSLAVSKCACESEVESSENRAKIVRSDEVHPTHPYYILQHLVKTVLTEKCRNANVKEFYKAQLEYPDVTIEECKSKLADWVLNLWDKGKLLDHYK